MPGWLKQIGYEPGDLAWPGSPRCCTPSGATTLIPPHTHDTWTLLLVDDGLIGYELEPARSRREPAA